MAFLLVPMLWLGLFLTMTTAGIHQAPMAFAQQQTTIECPVGEVPLEIEILHNPTEGFQAIAVDIQAPHLINDADDDDEIDINSFSDSTTLLLPPIYGRRVSKCVPAEDDDHHQCLTVRVQAMARFDPGTSRSIDDMYTLLPDEVSIVYDGDTPKVGER